MICSVHGMKSSRARIVSTQNIRSTISDITDSSISLTTGAMTINSHTELSMGQNWIYRNARNLNDVVDKVNAEVQRAVLDYNHYRRDSREHNSQHIPLWKGDKLFSINPDTTTYNGRTGIFAGHRFCEPGLQDATFEGDDYWIFSFFDLHDDGDEVDASDLKNYDSANCDKDDRYKADFYWGLRCDLAQYYAQPHVDKTGKFTIPSRVDAMKSFHPKKAGFTAIKEVVEQEIIARRPPDSRRIFVAQA
jgi:hypothetical protein